MNIMLSRKRLISMDAELQFSKFTRARGGVEDVIPRAPRGIDAVVPEDHDVGSEQLFEEGRN